MSQLAGASPVLGLLFLLVALTLVRNHPSVGEGLLVGEYDAARAGSVHWASLRSPLHSRAYCLAVDQDLQVAVAEMATHLLRGNAPGASVARCVADSPAAPPLVHPGPAEGATRD